MIYVTLANDREVINDLLISILESNYSDFWVEYHKDNSKKGACGYYELIDKHESMKLYDPEDPKEVWTLTKDKMINGFRILEDKNQKAFDRISRGEWDAEDADQWLQYSLFQTIIYS